MDFRPLEEYVNTVLYANKDLPGCDIIIKKDHKTVFRYQHGYSDMENKTLTRGDEMYLLYSCSKPVTAATAMRLIEEGKLDPDAPVSKYIPAFKDTFLMKEGKKVPTENVMTVRHLFTMTAGFDYNMDKEPIKKLFGETEATVSAVDFACALVSAPLCYEPGARYQYSLCLDVLGAVVEAVADMPFGEYQKKVLFEPLGMENTGYLNTVCSTDKLLKLYNYDAATKQISVNNNFKQYGLHDRYQSGGAGLLSTVDDYSKFAATLANGGTSEDGYRFLKPETVKMLHSEQLRTFANNCSFSCASGAGYGYGMGVRTLVERNDGQKAPIGEFGWDGAAGSYVMIDDVNNLSLFFATHYMGWKMAWDMPHIPLRDITYDCMSIEN